MTNSPYPDFDKKKFRVKVRHYPLGFNENFYREHNRYTTILTVFNVADRNTPIFSVSSKCNPGDIPRRKVGFRVAYEKAVKVAKALEII